MGWTTLHFGTLYFGAIAKLVPNDPLNPEDIIPYNGTSPIRLGDTYEWDDGDEDNDTYTITWIKPDDMKLLVADRVLLNHVSWIDLNQAGFVAGKKVEIDGRQYLCRLLKGGQTKESIDEWDIVISNTTNSDEVWHWSTAFTICSDFLNDGHRVVRGCISANGYNHCSPSTRDSEKGFRPVLIPLDSTQKEKGKKCVLDSHTFFVRGVKKAAANEIFLPVLEPADPTLYDGLVMNELYAYTLLMNGVPVRQDRAAPETYIDGATLELTDIFYGKEYLISWNILNGTAVANKGILRKVGVENLTTLGLLLNKKG